MHFNFQRPLQATPPITPLKPRPAKHSRNLASTRRRNFNRFIKPAELHPMRLRFQSTSADRYEVARKERRQLSPTLSVPQELFQNLFNPTPISTPSIPHKLLHINSMQRTHFSGTFSQPFLALLSPLRPHAPISHSFAFGFLRFPTDPTSFHGFRRSARVSMARWDTRPGRSDYPWILQFGSVEPTRSALPVTLWPPHSPRDICNGLKLRDT